MLNEIMDQASKLSKNSISIFLFHGVIERFSHRICNHTRKHIEKDYFINSLKSLKKIGRPVSLDDIVSYYNDGCSLPPYSFAITFDDGFENNYSIAAPVLKELDIPATFYVSTDFIDNNHMSWIDRIEYCLENISGGTLVLPWNDETVSLRNDDDKLSFANHLREYVKPRKEINLESLVTDVFRQLNFEMIECNNDPVDLKMSWNQIKELKKDKNFIIGGHSHSHLNLAFLSDEDLEYEVKTSLELLEEKAGIKTIHYSYPEGLSYCYSENVINILKKYGIVCCPTAEYGLNDRSCDLFHLKRIPVVQA